MVRTGKSAPNKAGVGLVVQDAKWSLYDYKAVVKDRLAYKLYSAEGSGRLCDRRAPTTTSLGFKKKYEEIRIFEELVYGNFEGYQHMTG